MYNWYLDEEKLKKDPEKYTIWKLEQMVNFGLNGKKINPRELKKYLPKLNLDPHRRKFIDLILNG